MWFKKKPRLPKSIASKYTLLNLSSRMRMAEMWIIVFKAGGNLGIQRNAFFLDTHKIELKCVENS